MRDKVPHDPEMLPVYDFRGGRRGVYAARNNRGKDASIDLNDEYRELAQDENRETEALAWAEAMSNDVTEEAS